MHKGSIGVAPEGMPFLFLLGLSSLVFAAIGCWPVAMILLIATWFAGHFFRDPERVVPTEPDVAVCPADGKVVRVEPRPDPITGESRTCISIFMNVFNVHVNRTPVAGRVETIRYFPGAFSTRLWIRPPRTTNGAPILCAMRRIARGSWCRSPG